MVPGAWAAQGPVWHSNQWRRDWRRRERENAPASLADRDGAFHQQGPFQGTREGSDVAALAGRPGYRVFFQGNWVSLWGTSAATPLWAALIARVNAVLDSDQRPRFLTPLLYRGGPGGRPTGMIVCRDITIGDNRSIPQPGKGYTARKGYDAVTGWGVPNGKKLLAALRRRRGNN